MAKEMQVIEPTRTRIEPRRTPSVSTACALVLLAGCAAAPPADEGAAYRRALADAAVAEPAEALPLRSIPQGATVQVVSWMRAAAIPCEESGCSFRVGADRLWVTLEGEVRSRCRAWGLHGDALRERLEQLLGLPPQQPEDRRKTHMVTFELARDALQRPCLGESADASGTVRCTLRPTAAADPQLRQFVLEQMAVTWVADGHGAPGYPFTRLGYTYDWHSSAAGAGHYGASEFVVRPGTEVRVTSATATDEYCRGQGVD